MYQCNNCGFNEYEPVNYCSNCGEEWDETPDFPVEVTVYSNAAKESRRNNADKYIGDEDHPAYEAVRGLGYEHEVVYEVNEFGSYRIVSINGHKLEDG